MRLNWTLILALAGFDGLIGGTRQCPMPVARVPCVLQIPVHAHNAYMTTCDIEINRRTKTNKKTKEKKTAEMELQHTEQQAQHIQLGIEKLCVIYITSWCWILLNGYITNIAYNILLAGMVLGCCPVSKRDRDDHAMRTTHTIFLL